MEGQAIIASGHQVKGWTWKGKGIFLSDEKLENELLKPPFTDRWQEQTLGHIWSLIMFAITQRHKFDKKETDCTINGGSWRISWSDICLCGQTPPPCCPADRLVLCLFFPKLFRRTRILILPTLIVVFQPQPLPICPPCQIQPIRHCYQMRGIIQLMTLLTNFTQRWIFNLLLVTSIDLS